MNRRGFTLIELLVVVLIIGILVAVALPQYQKAVLKTRFSGIISNTTTLSKSLEIYYLSNNSYPANLEEIDIAIGGCTTTDIKISCNDATYYYYHVTNKLGLGYLHYTQAGNTWIPNRRGRQYCWADSENEAANQICQSMRGTPDGTENWHASGTTKSGWWNKYKLP